MQKMKPKKSGEKPKTSAERTRKYRERMRKDPEKMKSAQEKDRERKHKERNEISREEKNELRKKNRQYMAQYRAKKQAENQQTQETPKSVAKTKTHKENLSKLKKHENYLKKREELLKKKAEVLRVQRYRWRLRVNMRTGEARRGASSDDPEPPFTSPSTQKRAVRRAKEALPTTPIKRARVVEKLAGSPSVAKILQKESPVMSQQSKVAHQVVQNLKRKLVETKPKGTAALRQTAAYKILKGTLANASGMITANAARCFNLKLSYRSRKLDKTPVWWKVPPRHRRKDRIPETVRERVREFFLSPEVSRQVPCKKDAILQKKDGICTVTEKHIMTMTLSEAFEDYRTEHPQDKVKLTSFKKLRPANVRKFSETNRRTCLCTACSNVALKLEAIRKYASHGDERKENLHTLAQLKKTALSDASLCDYELHPHQKCIDRACDACKTKLDTLLEPLEEYSQDDITWYHWEYVQLSDEKRRMSCVEKNTTVAELLNALKEDMKTFPGHLFRAAWQQRQMTLCKKKLDEGDVALCMDFAENYRICFKDEVQSGYFDPLQVTVHPMMAYYEEDGHSVKHAIIGCSPDTRHGAQLVKAFEDQALALLGRQPAFAQSGINTVQEWTDGCASQYKGRFAFADIAQRTQNPSVCRNFFETSHGKSVCDGLGSVVKNSCLRAITSGKHVISNAKQLYHYINQKLSHGPQTKPGSSDISKWDNIYIDRADGPQVDYAPVKGCRKFHAVRSTGRLLELQTRWLTCYCDGCIAQEACHNSEWVDAWTIKQLKAKRTENTSILYVISKCCRASYSV